MGEIHLIGTIHYEPDGARRLRRALASERPDILTVEASREWLQELSSTWDEGITLAVQTLREHGADEATVQFMQDWLDTITNYETEACGEYAARNRIPLYFIDDPGMVRTGMHNLKHMFREYIETQGLRDLQGATVAQIQSGMDDMYRAFQAYFEGKTEPNEHDYAVMEQFRGFILGRRDETEAHALEELAREPGKIVHVGGCMHMIDDPKGETLYSRIRHLHPTRKTLWAYDSDME